MYWQDMADRAERVPDDLLRSGTLLHRATRLTQGPGREIHDFCALQVRRQDLALQLPASIADQASPTHA